MPWDKRLVVLKLTGLFLPRIMNDQQAFLPTLDHSQVTIFPRCCVTRLNNILLQLCMMFGMCLWLIAGERILTDLQGSWEDITESWVCGYFRDPNGFCADR
jgi:hypothetical protein